MPTPSSPPSSGLATAPASKIRRAPSQPRRTFDEDALQELAASIRKSGLLQPLVVRELDGEFELIAGERRWRACKLAGIEDIPVVVREMTDAEAFATALVENIQREDLNPLEEALAPYGKDVPVVWVQEEPENNGAWHFLLVRYGQEFHGHPFSGVARPESASPATGSGAAAMTQAIAALMIEAMAQPPVYPPSG